MLPRSSKERRGRPIERLARVAPLLSATAVGALAWSGRGYTADDAFIAGRYALRIASGAGYTFRDGPPTDGVTGPALLAIEVPAAWLGLDPVLASKLLGACLVAAAAALVTARLRRRATGTLASVLAPLGFLASGALAMHAQSGLETGLATFLVTVGGLGATSSARGARAGRAASLALAAMLLLVPWLRPELVPLTLALGALHAVRASGRARRLRALFVAGLFVLGLASVILFRLALFGDPVPLSARAKPSDLGNGAGYVLVALAVLLGPLLLPILEVARRSRRDARLVLALSVAPLTVLLAGGDWMPGGRLLVPVVPLALMLAASGLARWLGTHRAKLVVSLGACLALLPQLALTLLVLAQADDVARSRRGPGAELRALLDREARVVALVDVGFLAYRARFTPIDLAGVTSPEIGTRPGGHCAKPVTLDDLLARDVDTLVLHSSVEPRVIDGAIHALRGHPVERALASDPRLSELFTVTTVVRYARGYDYVVLRRTP